MQHSINDTYHCQRLGFSSSASPQSTEKESKQSLDDGASVKENGASENAEPTKTSGEATASEKTEESGKTTACLLIKNLYSLVTIIKHIKQEIWVIELHFVVQIQMKIYLLTS